MIRPRPCTCDRQQGGAFVPGRDCKACWIYHNSPRYRLGSTPPGERPKAATKKKDLTDAEVKELFGESDPTLLGNRIAALLVALGIPPCGGCGKRKEWLNRAHQWLRGLGY